EDENPLHNAYNGGQILRGRAGGQHRIESLAKLVPLIGVILGQLRYPIPIGASDYLTPCLPQEQVTKQLRDAFANLGSSPAFRLVCSQLPEQFSQLVLVHRPPGASALGAACLCP